LLLSEEGEIFECANACFHYYESNIYPQSSEISNLGQQVMQAQDILAKARFEAQLVEINKTSLDFRGGDCAG
jgi:hypothetical protein